MATIKFIASGSSSDEDFSTPALSPWGTNTACFFAIITAYSSAATISHTVVNGGVTWNAESLDSPYASRRTIELFVADGVPTDVALDIESTGSAGTYAESLWCAFEIAEWDGTNRIESGPDVTNTGGATGLSASVGTIVDDEISVIIGGVESGSATNLAMNGDDLVGSIQEGTTDVRAMIVGSSTTDATPDFTWTTSSAAGALGFRSSDGVTGTHDAGGGVTPKGPLGMPLNGSFGGPI